MPLYEVNAPDGQRFEVNAPEGATLEDAFSYVKEKLWVPKEQKPKRKESLLTDVQRGAESFGSSVRAGVSGIFDPNKAAEEAITRQQDIQQRLGGDQSRLSKVEEAYRNKGLLSAAGTALGEIPSAIAEQVPTLATAFGGARVGAMAGAPLGPYGAVGGAIAGTFLPFFFSEYGGNIQQQAQLQKEKGEKVDVKAAKAAGFAVPMAGLEVVENFIPFGGKIVGGLFGKEVADLLKKGATKEAEQLAKEKLAKETFLPSLQNRDFGTLVKGTTRTALAEMPVEITQQMLGRVQSNQDLFSPEALRQYGETAFDVALLGPLGIYGRSVNKSQARNDILEAQRVAVEKNEPQEVLLLTYDPNVEGTVIKTPIIVNQDGSTAFPKQENKFKVNPVDEFTDAGLRQAYRPERAEPIPPPPPLPRPPRAQPIVPPVLYGTEAGQVGQTVEDVNQAQMYEQIALQKQEQLLRTVTPDTLKVLGIGPSAQIFKNPAVVGADLGNPDSALAVRTELLSLKTKNKNPETQQKIDTFLQLPFFQNLPPVETKPVKVKEEPPSGNVATPTITPTELISYSDKKPNLEPILDEIQGKNAPTEIDKFDTPSIIEGLQTFEVPVGNLSLSKDVPQFKSGASKEGVVEALGGKFDRTGVAPIQVWERLNGDLEIISGRHRFDLAKRSGEQTIPAQVHREADGFNVEQAASLDALLNIREGQGKVKDYVQFFQRPGYSREEAESSGVLARATGKRAFSIATNGVSDLIASHRADLISDEAATQIAETAPQDAALQNLGMKAVMDGKSITNSINLMQAVKSMTGDRESTGDLFGFDDSAMREAEQMAEYASKVQRDLGQRLSAITGAAKRPEIARAEGIDVKDEAAIQTRIEELRQAKAKWDRWSSFSELIAEIREGLKLGANKRIEQTPKKDFDLKATTPEGLEQAEKEKKDQQDKEDKAKKEVEEKEKKETEKKEVTARSKGAAKDFELGQSAEDNLSGQKGMEFAKGFMGEIVEPSDQKYSEGRIAYKNGDYGLIETINPKGEVVYKPMYKNNMPLPQIEVDAKDYIDKSKRNGWIEKFIPLDVADDLLAATKFLKQQAKDKHEKTPFVTYKNGIATSSSIPKDLAGVIAGWKDMLGLTGNIYVTTIEDVKKDYNNFTGSDIAARRVMANTKVSDKGVAYEVGNGNFVVAFKNLPSKNATFEVIAHEFGHVHEKQVYEKAPQSVKDALQAEHNKFLLSLKNKTGRDLIDALRARKMGKTTAGGQNIQFENVERYWKSFAEWYADQTAKWATTQEKPLTVVERFFSRLGAALRQFYQKLRNQKYLPTETFKTYMDSVTKEVGNSNFNPETIEPISTKSQQSLFAKGKMQEETGLVQVSLSKDEQQYFTSVFDNKNDRAELLELVPSAKLSFYNNNIDAQLVFDAKEMDGLDTYLADSWAAGKKQYGGEGASTLPKSFSSAGYKFLQKAKQGSLENPEIQSALDSMDGVDPQYAEKLNARFGPTKKSTIKEKFAELKPNFFDRLITGVFDDFYSIKGYSQEAYMKAVLSKSVDGALDGLLMQGQVYIKDGALDIRQGTKGLLEIMKPLGTDVERYQVWKALNRDAEVARKYDAWKALAPKDRGKEPASPSFPAAEVARRDELLKGDIDGKPRAKLFRTALNEENALNRSVLDVAKQQGIIDQAAYERFSNDIYYIPFYKQMEDGQIVSVQDSSKLTGQYFSKALKGGEKEKMGDLMENTLRNWSHILSASMKNAAANSTLKAAKNLKAAVQVKSTYEGKDVITTMIDGKKAYFAVNDPALVESISLISFLGPKSPFLDIAKGFTNALRFGVTLSPGYKIRNLFRDTIASAAISPVGFNVLDNVQRGLKLSDRGNPTFVSALAGGGVFELGAAHEGDQAALVKRLIAKGVKKDTILTDASQIKNILVDMYERYNEFGNRFENANRLALFKKMIDEGKTHLEASFAARDLLNFTGQGSFRAIKVISQVVPFFNTRLQGIYKLGRDGVTPTYRVLCNMTTGKPIEESDKLKAQRFSIVSSAVMLASMGLYMAYEDDEDFKKREDWDRDNFWWFRVGDTAYRLPKPFEIGALGTIAERSLEQIRDENVEGKVFYDRMRAIISDTLSLNPTPQFVKPLIDLYANKDSFTGAPIETSGMERLSKQERFSNNTSELAKALGGISSGAAKILTLNPEAQGVSPVQMDYAIKAYFGWLGSTVASVSDKAVQPWSDVEKPGKPALDQYALGFAKELPEAQSKYVTNFYDNSNRINQAFADMKRYAEQGEMKKVAEILAEKGDLISLEKVYNQTTDQLATYRKYINYITNRKDMAKEDKENEIIRIKVLISQVAENAENLRKSMKK